MEQNDSNYLDSQINLKAENVENQNVIEIEPEKISDKKDEENKEEKTSMEEKNDMIRIGEIFQTQIKIEPSSSNNKELKNLDQNIEEEMTLLTSLKIIEGSTSLDSPIHQSSPQLQLTPVQQSSNNTQSSASTSSSNSTIIQTSPNLSNGDKENNNPAKKKIRTRPGKDKKSYLDKKNKMKGMDNQTSGASDLVCVYCNLSFTDRADLQVHCQGEEHQHNAMSDEGKIWKFRPPPRTIGGQDAYKLCPVLVEEGYCRFALQCTDAHSLEEIQEWRERLEYRQKRAQMASKLYQSFNDQVMERLGQSGTSVNQVLALNLDGVNCACDKSANVTCQKSQNGDIVDWTFKLSSTSKRLRNISLLSDNGANNFQLGNIKQIMTKPSGEAQLRTHNVEPNSLEWQSAQIIQFEPGHQIEYLVKISFKAEIFGTFRQTIVFSFGLEPYLRRDVSVEVKPEVKSEDGVNEEENEEEILKLQKLQDVLVAQTERWSLTNCGAIKDFQPPILAPPDEDKFLYQKYPMPQPATFRPSKSVIDPSLTKFNYKNRMHELLYIEEMAQFEQISQFNVKSNLTLIDKYLLTPSSTNSSSAKYARPGELFGKMTLNGSLSEDTTAGRLILTHCTSLLLKGENSQNDLKNATNSQKGVAYLSAIEDSGKSILYLRLSSSIVTDFGLKDGDDFGVEVQFQLNRLPLCEMHLAIDKLPDMNLIYPDMVRQVQIPWTPGKHWSEDMNSRLNGKQREAILAVTSSLSLALPPILLIGPYGTGKTFTIAQSIMMLLKQQGTKILVCTHSNSAADLYIKDYLDPFITANPHIKLLRVYYKDRWVATVHKTVQKYCLIEENSDFHVKRSFKNPTKADILHCQIVVATLSTSRMLSTIGLPIGLFSHIFIDEAAQAMECEAIMPLALAYPSTTRLVLAGDHMQLSPEVFSTFTLEKKFNKSLLERLYNLYPINYPCKIHLTENYRSHEAIIAYTSELFYEQKLLASGKQTKHDTWHPLTLFTARGEDVQDANSTSFYNNAEVYEVVERVAELQSTWPKNWGHRDENAIGIVTPYYDQVQRIRSELRKRRLFNVSVERVLNVQGKQFRAIFLSTVRTRKTCVLHNEDAETDFGFLSNAKLLNTAITRAQSLVAVVGDPVALCSIGKCRKLWERFVDIARRHASLFGTTWRALRVMLDNCELRKAYVLNPLAPEFVPRARREKEAYLQQILNEMIQTNHRSQFMQNSILQHHHHAAAAQAVAAGLPRQVTPAALIGALPPPPFPLMALPPVYFPMPQFPPGAFAGMPPPGHPSLPPPQTGFMPPGPAVSAATPFMKQALNRASSPQKMLQHMGYPHNSSPKRGPAPFPLPQKPPPPANGAMGVTTINPQAASTSGFKAPPDKNFAFLQDGVHFPPIPKTAPPMKHHLPVSMSKKVIQTTMSHPGGLGGGASSSVNGSSGATMGGSESGPPGPNQCPGAQTTLMESALDVLPTDSDLVTFLQSPQLQMAWYMQLTVTQGEKEATLFKEVIVSMQQSPELLQDMKEQLEIKRQKLRSSGGSIGSSKNIAQHNIKQNIVESCSPYSSPPSNGGAGSKRDRANLTDVLMPSATSADTFYTLANAATRQHGQQQPTPTGGQSGNPGGSSAAKGLSMNEFWKSHATQGVNPNTNLNEGGWGSMNSMDTTTGASKISPSVPLYKRRAGGLGGEVGGVHVLHHDDQDEDDDGFLSNLLEPQPWSELATRSSTMPSSTLSSIWAQGSRGASSGSISGSNLPPPPSATSPINRTYANVLRHKEDGMVIGGNLHDPLYKIRQIGTRGSQELFDSASTSPNTTFQAPFSPLNGKW